MNLNFKPVSAQQAIALLNEASQLDPAAIRYLIENRVPCNHDLADHPTIQVDTTEDGEPRVGLLGMINGLFGVDENACDPVVAKHNENDPGDPVTSLLNPRFADPPSRLKLVDDEDKFLRDQWNM